MIRQSQLRHPVRSMMYGFLDKQYSPIPALPTKTRILATGDLYEMLVETDPQGTTNSRLRHYDYEPESEEQSAAVSDLNVWDDYLKLCEEAKTSVTAESQRRRGCQIEMLPGADIRVTTLGTGSACPSKYRNGAWTQQNEL